MKKTLLVAALLITSACKHELTKQEKAENTVKHLLDSTLNDPKSYESVKFGTLHKLETKVITSASGKPDTIDYHGRYELLHTYRAKNEFGGLITKTDCFQLDSTLTHADGGYTAQYP